MWYLYILLCENNKLYTGIARDALARFELHRAGRGAKYTQRNKPIKIVHIEEYETMSGARLREEEIKKMTRPQKDDLIRANSGQKSSLPVN